MTDKKPTVLRTAETEYPDDQRKWPLELIVVKKDDRIRCILQEPHAEFNLPIRLKVIDYDGDPAADSEKPLVYNAPVGGMITEDTGLLEPEHLMSYSEFELLQAWHDNAKEDFMDDPLSYAVYKFLHSPDGWYRLNEDDDE